MSHLRTARRPVIKLDVNQLSKALQPLLSPILDQINILNETVMALVDAFNNERKNPCDLACASLTADVSMMAADTHHLAKSCDAIKQQLTVNQQSLSSVGERLADMERLVGTLAKNEAKNRQLFEEVHPPRLKSASPSECENKTPLGLTMVTLNSEKDYPLGSWLGDPLLPNSRVRCPIFQQDLIFINTKCTTPAKMALTLLDYLFSKDTLATSNISGRSKLGKKQLDPVLIYGIKCHLRYHFNTTDKQWERIKHNIDSKCRTAWKKRRLTPSQYAITCDTDEDPDDENSEVIRSVVQGDHILHNVHVLDGDLILPMMSSDVESESDLVSADTVSFVMEPMLEVLTEQR